MRTKCAIALTLSFVFLNLTALGIFGEPEAKAQPDHPQDAGKEQAEPQVER